MTFLFLIMAHVMWWQSGSDNNREERFDQEVLAKIRDLLLALRDLLVTGWSNESPDPLYAPFPFVNAQRAIEVSDDPPPRARHGCLQVGQVRRGDEPPGGLLHSGPARRRRPRLRVPSGTRPP